MPENTVKVDRSTKYWGNPYRIGETFNDLKGGVRDAEHAVALYRGIHESDPERRIPGWQKMVGKNLACWCPIGAPCHADVMLELVAEWSRDAD